MDLATKKKKHLPNFFIVGAAKSSTTSLYYYLKQHPEIYMSPVKEPNFFSHKDIEKQGLYYKNKNVSSLKKYKKLFSKVNKEVAIGEASVSYLFYPKVPMRIKKIVPDARIIIILRNPIDRAFSHYLMDLRLGYVKDDFTSVLLNKEKSKLYRLYYQQYVELGFYFDQVKRYFDVFGKERVRVFLTEDLKEDSANTLKSIFQFLEIDSDFQPDLTEKYNHFEMPKNSFIHMLYSWESLKRVLRSVLPYSVKQIIKSYTFEQKEKPKMDEEAKGFLFEIYKNDVRKLEVLLGRKLWEWK